jgi:NADH-quinone oxidoreductase subunit N
MVYMYFKEPTEDFSWVKVQVGAVISVLIALAGVLYLGVIPGKVMDLAKLALF